MMRNTPTGGRRVRRYEPVSRITPVMKSSTPHPELSPSPIAAPRPVSAANPPMSAARTSVAIPIPLRPSIVVVGLIITFPFVARRHARSAGMPARARAAIESEVAVAPTPARRAVARCSHKSDSSSERRSSRTGSGIPRVYVRTHASVMRSSSGVLTRVPPRVGPSTRARRHAAASRLRQRALAGAGDVVQAAAGPALGDCCLRVLPPTLEQPGGLHPPERLVEGAVTP